MHNSIVFEDMLTKETGSIPTKQFSTPLQMFQKVFWSQISDRQENKFNENE